MDRFFEVVKKESRVMIGMMSGTSADGVDLVAVKISGCGKQTKVETLKTQEVGYPVSLREKILRSMKKDSKARDVCALDFELGTFLGNRAKDFIKSIGLKVDVIASHGQTVYHHPRPDDSPACTLQIGDGDLIAAKTGVITISDFRVKDIAYGGEGAPLVPHVDYILYSSGKESVAFNNLGGISNVTYIPKGASESDVIAFDTGPANALIDLSVSKFFDVPFDENGEFSSKGQIDEELLERLKKREMPYISRTPPKSTGKEVYNADYVDDVIDSNSNPYDIVRTLVEFTAWTIWESYKRYIIPNGLDRIALTGGGAMNKTMVETLKRYFREVQVEVVKDWKFREAKAFAVLANELLCSNPANNPKVTGANSRAFLGKISLP